MAPHNKGKGAALAWVRSHVRHAEPGCLIWPFATDRGYGQVSVNGKVKKAHRVMCELALGAPPTLRHEAAHSCGNGHLGCVHPLHLSWKTRTENHADAIASGTAFTTPKGGPRARLTREKANTIRSLKGIESQDRIAERFGVTYSTVAKIHRGELWK